MPAAPTSSSDAPGAGPSLRGRWARALAVYADRRMAKILLIGFISGFPWVLAGSMVTLWLQDEGFTRTGIGLFGLVFTVYAVNMLWAPIVDSVSIPWLTRAIGQRRSWIVLMQGVIAVAMAVLSTLDPSRDIVLISVWVLAITLSSATQDVAIDATRIELIGLLEARKVGAGSAMATTGWWAGYGLGGSLALAVAQGLQNGGVEEYWQASFRVLLGVIAVSVVALLAFVEEPAGETRRANQSEDVSRVRESLDARGVPAADLLSRAAAIYSMPVARFFRSHGARLAALVLASILLFKVGEAFLGRMSLVFYSEIGFSKGDIALYQKGLGTLSVCVFSILGSLVNARYGLFKGLILGGVAMASTNLLFALLAWYPVRWLFTLAVVTDQFTTAVSTVAFVAFISQLCDRTYTATQYAAFASLGNLSRTTLSAASGWVVDSLGGSWPTFFVLTTLMVLPSLTLLLLARKSLAPLMEGRRSRLL